MELHWALTEYDCIVSDVIPVTAMILVSIYFQSFQLEATDFH